MTVAEALKIASHAVSPIWGSGTSLTYSEPYDPAAPDGPRTETQCGAYGYAGAVARRANSAARVALYALGHGKPAEGDLPYEAAVEVGAAIERARNQDGATTVADIVRAAHRRLGSAV